MTQYIDKDALVSEIEKRWRSLANKNVKANGKYDIEIYTLLSIKTFIDTLEVKEVDLEKEYKEFVVEDPVYNKLINGIVGKAIAKHFFELGLNAQKEE